MRNKPRISRAVLFDCIRVYMYTCKRRIHVYKLFQIGGHHPRASSEDPSARIRDTIEILYCRCTNTIYDIVHVQAPALQGFTDFLKTSSFMEGYDLSYKHLYDNTSL